MNVYSHKRIDGSLALYIDGNLQFDSRDEAVYHESLALPALCLAKNPKTALICGGGDGLALREILRFPGIEKVTLVDCSLEVLTFARTELKTLNQNALEDPRVQVVVADALTHPLPKNGYDVIVCDFTFPTTEESALGFTLEWYQKLHQALTSTGILAVNAVSPQNTASAFACIVNTLRAAHLKPLPYRVCIPSFRDHGYGAWGFVLASKNRLTIDQLQNLNCPVETTQANLPALARAAHFNLKERAAFASAPINRANNPVLQRLLLNPTTTQPTTTPETPPDFPNLIQQVEISHPYHSRGMIEALAEQVVGSLHTIDLRKLVDELTARAKRLPQRLLQELATLREYLTQKVLDIDVWGKWASRLFATLVLVITIANTISPDPAFAKGMHGLGHSSFSRGFGAHESFLGTETTAHISGRGFTSTYGRDPVDVYGYHYSPSVYFYDHSYDIGYQIGSIRSGHHNDNPAPLYQPKPHKPLFVLDDDLLAMENGDFVVPLSDSVFLVISNGSINLMDSQGGRPLMPIFAEPKLFTGIRTEVAAQGQDLEKEIGIRRDWLSWTGWSSALFPSVKADNDEYNNLQDLQRRLSGAMKKLGTSPESQTLPVPEGVTELFVGCHILPDNTIAIHGPGSSTVTTLDGSTLTGPDGHKQPIPPALKTALVSVIKKMANEAEKDIAADIAEQKSLRQEYAATQNDLSQYNSIQAQNYDPYYEVDYGTDSVPVYHAIELTNSDLSSIQLDMQLSQVHQQKSGEDLARFRAVLQAWGQ